MCGIIGYIGNRKASEILLKGLKRLEYRGYDSCGIGIIDNNNLIIKKDVGRVEEVAKKEDFLGLNGNVAIGHNRWATHGHVSKENAHPHTDCKAELCIVHNGIISNYKKLKKELISKGHKFKSQTDSEVIVHLIEEELKKYKNPSEEDYINAVKEVSKKLEGSYAILILNKNFPHLLVGLKNESPLILGVKEDECFLGSDISAFLEWTKEIIPLEDGDIVVLRKYNPNNNCNSSKINNKSINNKNNNKSDKIGAVSVSYSIYNKNNNITNERKKITINWDIESAEKAGYDHFMLKEIMEEPDVVKNSSIICNDEIKELAKALHEYNRIYIVAMGTSLHASMIAEYWFSKLNKLVIACDSSEFLIKGIVDKNTLVIGITQSGETYDTVKAIKYAKEKGAKTATIVNVLGSTATREADITIMMGSGIEISVCATKTYLSQLMILYRLFIEYGEIIGKDMSLYRNELKNIPEYIKEVISEKERINIKNIAKKLTAKNYIFISKGINLPNALEGALKFKEITYLHAEGMSSGFLKHGTISLIDENMDTIALVPPSNSNLFNSVVSNIEEIKARNGKVVGISPVDIDMVDYLIKIPNVLEEVSPFVYAPACQLLAYYKAVELGRDVDKPRGLAKSVTVE
ncbi:glutamine--fructose-6-phosphate aminotransferase [Methanothermococcus okinawensis]|uniref:Glutamine--fructose-6-phosphate aminotransferase [isomerizing] n=1 Tax=Methanothermococcus okinawensis (strain DSM 14208 / JCM 11175 / IH1) TaxID=647113 RepID=F8AN46_METOI|nr:glutamine--fructose-6-phosphate aminotransferase [Methanothermococcus okinawensis]AEH06960.1 Glucosamine--fructose-6-phosphate aminotransferase (isomerizing) [Methanothermococcus okinawensis IH1]